MIHRSRLYDDAGSNRRKQCRPQEEPEDFKRRGTTAAEPSAHIERYLSERVLNLNPA